MICSSVRIVRFIVHPFLGPDPSRSWKKNPGAGHPGSTALLKAHSLDDGSFEVHHVQRRHLTRKVVFHAHLKQRCEPVGKERRCQVVSSSRSKNHERAFHRETSEDERFLGR
jgi:hypothetical protein